jgi:hypothetical protein
MIDLGTLRGLWAHQHELHGYCAGCDRWHPIDLGLLVSQGQGEMRLPIRVRCRRCGERGQLQVRPPMPTRSSIGWIAPPTPSGQSRLDLELRRTA